MAIAFSLGPCLFIPFLTSKKKKSQSQAILTLEVFLPVNIDEHKVNMLPNNISHLFFGTFAYDMDVSQCK